MEDLKLHIILELLIGNTANTANVTAQEESLNRMLHVVPVIAP